MTETGPADHIPQDGGGGGNRRRRLLRFLYWSAVAGIWLTIAGAGVLFWLAHDLPDLETAPPPGLNDRIEVRAENGVLLATYGAIYGGWLDYGQIPPIMEKALLAVEDRRFYDHGGVDFWAVGRAFLANLRAGDVEQGASTITQQLAKNLFLTPERSLKRKVQEVLLSFWLEQQLSKTDILTLYLNRMYFGAGTYGLEAASRTYFGHSATRLTLAEAAMLAGLLKAPSRYAPTRSADAARARTGVVLQAMVDAGAISKAAAASARENPANLAPATGLSNDRYFTDWIMKRLQGLNLGPRDAPLVVTTTLSPTAQGALEGALVSALQQSGAGRDIGQGAGLVLTTDGAVKALLGGRDYSESQFNRAVSARRQPGSAFKTIVYLAALEAGRDPNEAVLDGPVTVDGWTPENFSGEYLGYVPVHQALALSLNTAAVRLAEETGRARVRTLGQRLGLEGLHNHPSLALGTAEVSPLALARAYTVIANGGFAVQPYGILEVRTQAGELLYRRPVDQPARLLSQSVVGGMTAMLAGVIDRGTGRNARLDRPAAGKSGTSQDYRDAWFVGFTSRYVGTIWLGNDDGSPMARVTGGGLPARIWQRMMLDLHAGQPAEPLLAGDAPRLEGDEIALADLLDWVD